MVSSMVAIWTVRYRSGNNEFELTQHADGTSLTKAEADAIAKTVASFVEVSEARVMLDLQAGE